MSNDTEQKKRWPWGKIALTLSLALNLVFVGSMAGAGWMRHKHGMRDGGPPDFIIKRVVRNLPEARQAQLTQMLKQHFTEARPTFKQVRAKRRALKQALDAEPFSSDKVLKVTREIAALKSELDARKADLLVKILEPLSAQERQKLLRSRFFRRMLGAGRRYSRRGPPH